MPITDRSFDKTKLGIYNVEKSIYKAPESISGAGKSFYNGREMSYKAYAGIANSRPMLCKDRQASAKRCKAVALARK